MKHVEVIIKVIKKLLKRNLKVKGCGGWATACGVREDGMSY
jgi:hypothetical protein